MNTDDLDRRTVVRGVGVLAAGVFAGCSGDGSGSESDSAGRASNGGDDGVTTGERGPRAGAGGESTTTATGDRVSPTEASRIEAGTSMGTDTGSTATTGGGTGGGGAQVEKWLADAKNDDGSVADRTGSDTVTVAVGAGESGYAFDPAAMRVSPGTTVRWAWTGEGYAHNVVAKDGAFDSGQPQSGADVTYETTLDEPGTYRYYCEPHRRLGMKGAVVVGEA